MARIVNTTSTVTLNPSGYTNTSTVTVSATYPYSNAFDGISSTNYALFWTSTRSTTGHVDFTFDTSDIPDGSAVTISSVTAQVRARTTSTSSSTRADFQLYAGASTAKGSYTRVTSTTSTTYTLTAGTWTRDELDDLRLRVSPYTTSVSSNRAIRFYGANITITYNVSTTAYTIGATSNVSGVTVTPSTQEVYAGEDATEIRIDCDDITDYSITDNGVDISAALERHSLVVTATVSSVPQSYTAALNGSGSWTNSAQLAYPIGYSAESPRSGSAIYTSTRGLEGNADYTFDFSSIPSNATIETVEVKCYGFTETTSTYTYAAADISLFAGNVQKGTTQKFTSTSSQTITITDPGTWTRTELQNAKLRFTVGRYGGYLGGVTWKVTYSIPSTDYYWTYSLLNVDADHVILIEEPTVYIPPEEDPTETYWPITISSINAKTSPPNGTIRVIEGTNHTITITPEDPQLTLALDNGVDITSQLQGGAQNTYTVTPQQSGASYGFTLNSTTGYYVSNNTGVSNSAAVARVNFDFDTPCLVTIQYINYAEATYDYGIFGQVDTAVATTSTADSNAYYSCNAAASNTSTPQTLTYNIAAGTHFIDVKYRKDQATNSNNDTLQWKILSIESTSGNSDYTYTLTNVTQKHSVIFIFGDVNFYYITSSGPTSGVRLFPDGQIVVLEGDNYKLNIVPDNINAAVSLTDNGVNQTSQLEQLTGVDKNNNPVVSYTYTLHNIQTAHTIAITIGTSTTQIYLKENGAWVAYSKVYKKINGSWVEQSDLSSVFSTTANYVKSN